MAGAQVGALGEVGTGAGAPPMPPSVVVVDGVRNKSQDTVRLRFPAINTALVSLGMAVVAEASFRVGATSSRRSAPIMPGPTVLSSASRSGRDCSKLDIKSTPTR